MEFLNFLASEVEVHVFDTNLQNVPLTGVTKFVADVIEFFSFGGYIAVGILIFSLLLKIIPLPFDIYSRVATKKNALKMERMRPELEKLQRQYANNKELYSQKMMALYKKEGYSTFASCLPTLFTLIFFIIVISAFNQYSTYTKVEDFNQMAIAYSQSVRENEFVEERYYATDSEGNIIETEYYTNKEDLIEGKKYITLYCTNLQGDINTPDSDYFTKIIKPAQDAAADKYLEGTDAHSFLWVKNIWIEDLPWKKAFIAKSAYKSSFSYSKGCSCSAETISSSISDENVYNVLMGSSKLDGLKNAPNGYLILVILSIGSMLLSQLIMTKSQKAQLELQTVDETAQQTNKMMLWMMPIMFGVFSFMYTASFSLYLIVSTLFSMFSTILINKIVEKKFEKEIKRQEEEKYNKRFGYLNKKNKD